MPCNGPHQEGYIPSDRKYSPSGSVALSPRYLGLLRKMKLEALSVDRCYKVPVITAACAAAICLYFGWSWFEWVTMRFSRAQLGTHPYHFGHISGISSRRLNGRKPLSDEGLELVPGGGIEPSTHGFSGRASEFHNFLKLSNLLKWLAFHLGSFC